MVSPTEESPQEMPPASPPPRRYWLWAIAILSVVLGGGVAFGWYFIRYRLIPLIEGQVSPILGRPVDLGEIESLGLGGVRLGPSSMPATEEDPDRIEIAAIAIEWDVWEILRTRAVSASVAVENPRIYVEQAEDGEWISLELNLPESEEEPQELPVDIGRIDAAVRDTEIVLVPRQPNGELGAEYRATFPEVNAAVANDLELAEFDVAGSLEMGTVRLAGMLDVPTGDLTVSQVQLEEVTLAQFLPLIAFQLPEELQAAEVDGAIAVDLALSATLSDLPADILETLDGRGSVSLQDIAIRLPQLKEAVTAVGELQFQGSTVAIAELGAQFSSLSAAVTGNIDTQQGYNLTATVAPASLGDILGAVDLDLPPVDVTGEFAAEARVTGQLTEPQITATLTTPAPITVDRAVLGTFVANARLDENRAILDEFSLDAPNGGGIQAQGFLDLTSGDWAGDFAVRDLNGEIARPYLAAMPTADLGQVNAEGNGQGNLYDLPGSRAAGTFSWESIHGRVDTPIFQLENGKFAAQVAISNVALQPFVPVLAPEVTPLNGQIGVQATLPQTITPEIPFLEALTARVDGGLQVGGGVVQITDTRLEGGLWRSTIAVNALPLGILAVEGLPPELLQPASLNAQIAASGRVDTLSLDGVVLDGRARVDGLAEGAVDVPQIQLQEGTARVLVRPEDLRLDVVAASFEQPVLAVPTPVAGELELEADVDELLAALDLTAAQQVQASGNFTFANGLAVVTDPLDVAIAWDGQTFELVEATATSLDASGTAALDFAAAGLDIVGPYGFDIAARDLDLSLLPLPVEVTQWVQTRGLVSFTGTATGGGLRNPPESGPWQPQDIAIAPNLNGELRLQDFYVNNYSFDPEIAGPLSANLDSGVDINLQGNRGTAIQVAANLAPPGRFLPVEPQSFLLRLQDIERAEKAEIRGQRTGEEFTVTIRDVVLQQFRAMIPLPAERYAFWGGLTGDVTLNLANLDTRGNVALTQSQLLFFRSNVLSAEFDASPRAGRFNLSEGRLDVGESDFRLQAAVNANPENLQDLDSLEYEATLNADRARLQDIFTALQLRNPNDISRALGNFSGNIAYGNASDLDVQPIALADAPLGDLLDRHSIIDEELAVQRANQDAAPLPPLTAIEGDYSLNANIKGRGLDPNAASGKVRLDGQAWQWGVLGASEVEIDLELADGRLTVLPVRLGSPESAIEIAGSTGLDITDPSLSFTIDIRDIPIAAARNFVEFPDAIGFDGDFEARVTIAGSPQNPNATGSFEIARANINQTPIERVDGAFTYNKSTLELSAGSAITTDSTPVSINGTVPLQLPTSPIEPESDLLSLQVSIRNDALRFLDVLSSGNLRWGGGKAAVELDISGPFDPFDFQNILAQVQSLETNGSVSLADATLFAAVLEDPVEGINGEATFDLSTLNVSEIRAQLNEGNIHIKGSFPFFQPDPEKLLLVEIDPLELRSLSGLLDTQVEGTVVVGGSALATRIGGNVRVYEGKINLANIPQSETGTAVAAKVDEAAPDAEVIPPTAAENFASTINLKTVGEAALENSCQFAPETPLVLRNFNIQIDPKFQVSVPLLADFFAAGNLAVDGPLLDIAELCPDGIVNLERGTIALGSTRFRLDKDYPQTATFIPTQGLDPTLNVRMRAPVAETIRQPEIDDPSQTEIEDTSGAGAFGATQTIQVTARIDGVRASALLDSTNLREALVLESVPSRSQGELFSLVGQGLLGGGALGLASSLTSGLQAELADTLGLSEFAIFPLPVADSSGSSSSDDNDGTTTLQLAAEAGLPITKEVTFSLLAILTDTQPLIYSLRYRITDNIFFRGLTDFEANESAEVRFDTRF